MRIQTSRTVAKSKSSWGWSIWVLGFFGLFILGTFIVLSTAVHFFGTHQVDFITPAEVQSFRLQHVLPFNSSLPADEAASEEQRTGLKREKIPRIVHQTWKTDILPERWAAVKKECMRMLPEYEFKLWSDASGRELIQQEYPSFLATWDSYPYNIQRADAIRYFVLHKFGGIYMDLDIGCRAHPGPLMHFESILPVTKPVGVSNDLIFSAPGTPFMDLAINSLETFNHEWLWMNYPTVMFSTGPMFISAIYSMWSRMLARGVGIHELHKDKRVRILPKAFYGKNAPAEEVPESFFWHYYGSSWHSGDAGFIGFLGKYGYGLLLVGSSLVFVGVCYLLWSKRSYLPFSPRPKARILQEPFANMPSSPGALQDEGNNAVQALLKQIFSSISNPFSSSSNQDIAYAPLPTNGETYSLSRPPSCDTDAVSLHSVHGNGGDPSLAKIRSHHPVTKKPHARQRSRDVERGSPTDRRSNSKSNGSSDKRSSWFWPPTPSRRKSTPAAGSSYDPTDSPEPVVTDLPPTAKISSRDTKSPLIPSTAPLPSLSPLSAQVDLPNGHRGRQLSDGEVSSSELMDLLTDLQPVVSATSGRGTSTPRDMGDNGSQSMRKRSLSSEGERFNSDPSIGNGNSSIAGR